MSDGVEGGGGGGEYANICLMARFVCPLNKNIASNLYEGMDICPFECGHLPPLYKKCNPHLRPDLV